MAEQGRHTLADHALGALFAHTHDGPDHDHDHDEDFAEDASTAPLISLGLDVGSSSTQAVVSRLDGRGAAEVLYASPVMATPFRPNGGLDEAGLWTIVQRVFREAGVGADEIDTGAVILTGAAAERRNAEAVAHQLSHAVGDLVCAAAGDHMEARLAAYGSGAVAASREGPGRRLLLLDVGGATTKLALVERGEVLATAAMAVGGRLLVVDRDDRVLRLEPWGARQAERAGFGLACGERLPPDARQRLARAMAEAVLETVSATLGSGDAGDAARASWLTAPLPAGGPVDGVMVSGGVGEYVYGRERRDFGDLGPALGLALRQGLADGRLGAPLLEPAERIRATAIGASRHSVQVSGDTLYLSSHAALLPRRNLPVMRLALDLSGPIAADRVAQAVQAALASGEYEGREFALALPWAGEPSHARLHALALGLTAGLGSQLAERRPLYLMLEGDAAASLGAILREELGVRSEVLVIDGVRFGPFDYVDLGRLRLPSRTVPVTVKSLVFSAPPHHHAREAVKA